MKFLLLVTLLMFGQICFAQTLVDEYERTDSDSESARIDNFLTYLQNEPQSKGLIIINIGEKKEQIGIVQRHIEGIKQYVEVRTDKSLAERIFFKISGRKKLLSKELWIYPKYLSLPELKIDFDLSALKTKYLYGMICEICEPVVPSLSTSSADLESYAEILKKYPNYKSLIILYPNYPEVSKKAAYQNALNYAADYRNLLTRDYKISNKRISIVIAKNFRKGATTKLFIVPKVVK